MKLRKVLSLSLIIFKGLLKKSRKSLKIRIRSLLLRNIYSLFVKLERSINILPSSSVIPYASIKLIIVSEPSIIKALRNILKMN